MPLTASIAPGDPLFLHSWDCYRFGTAEGIVESNTVGLGTFASRSWPSANLALYWPLKFARPYFVARVWWLNGSSATGNVDIGLYRLDGSGLWTLGGVARSGASAIQYATLGQWVQPGEYYAGISSSGTANVCQGTAGMGQGVAGLLQQTSAYPLPSSMIPVTTAGTTWPSVIFGFTRTAAGF